MPNIIPTLIILSAAGLFILFILFRLYDAQVEKPRKLEDELKEALNGQKPDPVSIEPVRKAAVALHYPSDKFVLVREFGKLPTVTFPLSTILGLELMIDGKVIARVIRGGVHKMIDDTTPSGNEIKVRYIFDDPVFPSYELLLWHPTDGGTARSEGPRAAMDTARKWFYHIEAVMRHPKAPPSKSDPMSSQVTPASLSHVAAPISMPSPQPEPPPQASKNISQPIASTDKTEIIQESPGPKTEGDILNAPLVPYI